MIRCNINVLLAQKENREGRKIPYRVITEETRLSSGVMTRLVNSEFDRVERGTLDTLCRYFACGVGDLLEYIPDAAGGTTAE